MQFGFGGVGVSLELTGGVRFGFGGVGWVIWVFVLTVVF